MNKRDELKAQYVEYRDRAIEMSRGTDVKVAPTAEVQMTEDGAFVEAMIWIPKKP